MRSDCPTLSIVTPSYNQGQFLEDAIRSVILQEYPNLEYVVIDGGSSDGSVEMIKKYQSRLAYWTSGPDKGQYDAINKGFEKTSGEIMGWLNSDDKFTPWAFSVVAEIFSSFPSIEWISTVQPLSWNRQGQAMAIMFSGGFNRTSFLKGGNLPTPGSFGRRFIQQESTFWRRSLWERAGGRLDTSLQLAADFELWARFYRHADLYGVLTPLGGFRSHGDQKSVLQAEAYMEEAARVLKQYGGRACRGPEALIRGVAWKLGRHLSLAPLPGWMRAIGHRSKLMFPTKVVGWTGEKWEIISGFVV
jgi:glycosyltransferase involved in cell wall biosynthesis